MDWSTIVVAALALIGTLAGSYMANNKATALITYRMDQLEKKVEKHNSVVERTYKLEKDVEKAFVIIGEMHDEMQKLS